MSQLSEALKRANRSDLSTREIERLAAKAHLSMSVSTISRYLNGKHPRDPSLEVVQAFATVFGTDVNTILRDAQLPTVGKRFELPAEADRLDEEDRELVLHLVRHLASRREQPHDIRRSRPIEEEHPEAGDFDLAAYEDGGPSAWKHRRDEDARRGEESQEHPYDD